MGKDNMCGLNDILHFFSFDIQKKRKDTQKNWCLKKTHKLKVRNTR